MNGRGLVALGFFGAVAITTWHWIKHEGIAPPPSAFVGSGMVYGTLAIISEFSPPLAGAMSIGWTLGLLYYTTSPQRAERRRARPTISKTTTAKDKAGWAKRRRRVATA